MGTIKWQAWVEAAQVKHGDKLDLSDVEATDRAFLEHFRGERIVVEHPIFGRRRGTVSITTGWKPGLLLIHRITDHGSSDLLGPGDVFVGLAEVVDRLEDEHPRHAGVSDKQIEDGDHEFERESRRLQRAFATDGGKWDAEACDAWWAGLLSIDPIADQIHHISGWHATAQTPVLRVQMSTGGPGDQWELALELGPRSNSIQAATLMRAAYVYLPSGGYSKHYLKEGSANWLALADFLAACPIADEEIASFYNEED